jgi:hypothetical protein
MLARVTIARARFLLRLAPMAVASVRPDLLYAWHGASLLITNTRGQCGCDQPLAGFYYREARHLRTLALDINGRPPWLCEAASADPTSLLFTFVHPEIAQPGGGGTGQAGDEEGIDPDGLPERSLNLRLAYRVGVASLDITLTIANHARQPVAFTLAWTLDADFADIQEAQAGRREQQAGVALATAPDHLSFSYLHPELPFRTEVRHGGSRTASGGRLQTELRLASQQHETFAVQVVPHGAAVPKPAPAIRRKPAPTIAPAPDSTIGLGTDRALADGVTEAAARQREEAVDRWRERFTRVEAPGNTAFEAAVRGNLRTSPPFRCSTGNRTSGSRRS